MTTGQRPQATAPPFSEEMSVSSPLPPARGAGSPGESGPRALWRTAGMYAGGNLVSVLLRMGGGVLAARAVEPATLGLMSSITLTLGYLHFLQLGALNGITRELPYLIGKGERAEAEALVAAGSAWALLLGSTVATVLGSIAAWQALQGRWDLCAGWATTAVSAFCLFYAEQFLRGTYRSGGDFRRLAVVTVVEALINVVMVAGVFVFAFYGLCLRIVTMAVGNAGLLWLWRPIRVAPRWSWHHLRRLFRVGMPIMAVGQLYGWWTVFNSTLVLKFMGTEGLGLYALPLMVGPTLMLLPKAIGQITYPRMAEEHGRSGDLSRVLRVVHGPTLQLVVIIAPLIAVGWFALPPLVQIVLPRYVDAIPAAQWSLFLGAVTALTPVNNIFFVIKRQWLYGVAVIVGMAANYGFLLLLIRSEVGLAAFVQAMLAGKAVFIVLSYLAIAYLVRRQAGGSGVGES